MICDIALCLIRSAYNLVLPSALLALTLLDWQTSTCCEQRLDFCIFLIALIGPHKCIAIVRAYQRRSALEFETTTILWIVAGINYARGDGTYCQLQANQNDTYNSAPQGDSGSGSNGAPSATNSLASGQLDQFQHIIRFVFNILLISNTVCYILFAIIIIVAIIFALVQLIRNPHAFMRPQQPQGMTQAQINLLQNANYGDQFSNQVSCAICLENFEKQIPIVIMPRCRHIFHVACVTQWLRDKSTCPYCRQNLQTALGIMDVDDQEHDIH